MELKQLGICLTQYGSIGFTGITIGLLINYALGLVTNFYTILYSLAIPITFGYLILKTYQYRLKNNYKVKGEIIWAILSIFSIIEFITGVIILTLAKIIE